VTGTPKTPPSTTEEAAAKPDQAGAAGAAHKAAPPARLGTWQSVALMFKSWRLASVALQSFASGLPLGLVWIAIPTWMTQAGVDIKVVGLFTLAQAPWTFKFLWSPLMDRYPPPFMGRKRGWIFAMQLALALVTFQSEDHQEALPALREKRLPVFKDR